MVGLRGDIHTVKTELQSYQSSIAKELASLKDTTSEVEKSLSVCNITARGQTTPGSV